MSAAPPLPLAGDLVDSQRCNVEAICRPPDSAHQSSGLLQLGAVDNIFCAGDEAAATVSPWMREMRQREIDVAAVSDRTAEEVSTLFDVLHDCHG